MCSQHVYPSHMSLADLVINHKLHETYISGKISHFLHEGLFILENINRKSVTWGSMKNNLYFAFFQVAYMHGKWELRTTRILMN